MSRFDAIEGTDYGTCHTCGISIPTEADGRDHMRSTMQNDKSHSLTVLNPTREHRIRTTLSSLMEEAIDDAIEEVDRLVRRGELTEEEATSALVYAAVEPADVWADYLEENS